MDGTDNEVPVDLFLLKVPYTFSIQTTLARLYASLEYKCSSHTVLCDEEWDEMY